MLFFWKFKTMLINFVKRVGHQLDWEIHGYSTDTELHRWAPLSACLDLTLDLTVGEDGNPVPFEADLFRDMPKEATHTVACMNPGGSCDDIIDIPQTENRLGLFPHPPNKLFTTWTVNVCRQVARILLREGPRQTRVWSDQSHDQGYVTTTYAHP